MPSFLNEYDHLVPAGLRLQVPIDLHRARIGIWSVLVAIVAAEIADLVASASGL